MMNDGLNGEFLRELDSSIKRYNYWGHHYFILNDYFNGIGTVISIVVPFGFAALLYLPKENASNEINLVLLIISAVGLLLTLARSLFKFPERAKFHLKQLEECTELKIKIVADQISIEKAVELFIAIKKKDKNEPVP